MNIVIKHQLLLIGLGFLAIALPFATYLSSTNLDNRNRAAYDCLDISKPPSETCNSGWSCNSATGLWTCPPVQNSGCTSPQPAYETCNFSDGGRVTRYGSWICNGVLKIWECKNIIAPTSKPPLTPVPTIVCSETTRPKTTCIVDTGPAAEYGSWVCNPSSGLWRCQITNSFPTPRPTVTPLPTILMVLTRPQMSCLGGCPHVGDIKRCNNGKCSWCEKKTIYKDYYCGYWSPCTSPCQGG